GLLTQRIHAVEDGGDVVPLRRVRLGSKLERALAKPTIGGPEEWQKLRWRLLRAVPFDGHGADELRPFGDEPGKVAGEGDVGLVEDPHLVPEPFDHGFEPGPDVAKG